MSGPLPLTLESFEPSRLLMPRARTVLGEAAQKASAAKPLLDDAAWAALRRWYRDRGRHTLPWRRNRSPWRVLVAETLLHRTRADIAAEIYPKLVVEFPSPSHVLEKARRWRELMRPAGLQWRAEAFLEACRRLVVGLGGHVPEDPEALSALPGVGHYVIAAVQCFGFGRPAVVVDTNTIRLSSRISGTQLDPANHRARIVHDLVARLGPGGKPPDADENFALLDLAALVCRPKTPLCGECPVRRWCETGRCLVSRPS